MPSAWRKVSLLLAMLAFAGCTGPIQRGRSPLMPAQMSPGSVALDVFCVRFPFGDPEVNDKLWEEIDEQHFPADLRERLAQNGFRVGVITGQMPAALFKLLELDGKPPPNGKIEETVVDSVDAKPRVVRRHMQLPSGQRSEILASDVYEELPVLKFDHGQLCGQTYRQAQGVLAIKQFAQPNGLVRLELTPEVHHDQRRQRMAIESGMMQFEYSRPRRVFDDLAIPAQLSPGAFLVLGNLPNRPGSLGHHFFTVKTDDRQEQKLYVVYLSQTQTDGLFDSSEPLPIDEPSDSLKTASNATP